MKKLHRAIGRRAACIGLTAAMSVTFIAGQALAFADGKQSLAQAQEYNLNFEDANGKLDLTEIKLANLSQQVTANTSVAEVSSLTRTVIVTLSGKSLSERGDESRSAQEELGLEQRSFLKELTKAGVSYTLRSTYSAVVNGVAIDVQLSELQKIKAISGVKTVTVGSTYARPEAIETSDGAQFNYSNIYENGIYNSEKYLDMVDGSGMTVAILDTGLDYTHPAFAASQLNDAENVTYTYDKVAELMNQTQFMATERTGATADDVYISAKVPFAYDYADSDNDVYPSYSQHGTHVAGIIAGKADSYTNKDGDTATYVNDDGEEVELPFRGVAPEAQLVICKVFTDNLEDPNLGGADAVDIIDALEDCYRLNVDIVNMSLGTSAGFSSVALGLTPADEEGVLMKGIYERMRDKGITMMIAASNDYSAGYGSAFGTNLTSNPDSGTVGSPSTFDGAMSVASINGQYSPYILANATISGNTVTGGDAIYYEESRNEDSDAYNFLNDLLGDDPNDPDYKTSGTFKYVVIPGTGEAGDYTQSIKNELADKGGYDKVIAVIKRGISAFKDKIETAKANGADAVIVYNNVSGMIRMSLGDMQEHIPAVSVSLDEGLALVGSGATKKITGTVTLDRSYQAGPFMNDYSSWGATPDLKLKPDITSHGGEITSTVAGGYEEMSGTSMACPNLAGFTALLKSYLKTNYTQLWQGTTDNDAFALTKLTNNILMSTATTVYDQNKLPYSPRKQGAGLATMANVFSTNAYLYTDEADGMCADGRPKAELGEDAKKTGVYNIVFYVNNFGEQPLTFTTNSIFMTETVGADGKSVAEKAHLFGDDAVWTVGGTKVAEGGSFSVPAGETRKIEVTLTLTSSEKAYLDANFANGMFIEGFLQLKGSDGQCDLNFPFMGFYGSWKDAPMMDLTAFDIAEDARDTSLKDEQRRQASVWATQAYGYYYNEQYNIPLGSFVYVQDEAKEHTADYVYTEEEHVAISRFNEYYGDNNTSNYLTSTGIRALYAGLLRNAEIVTYTLTNVDTGEIIPDDNGNEVREYYRANKSYAAGGSSVPSQVLLEMRTNELGLMANGTYCLDFTFYFSYEDYVNGTFTDEDGNTYGVYKDNTFSMNFFVDYEAPVLVDSRIRFQDFTDENNKLTQKVYLDLDIFDNHYPQAVLLCYTATGSVDSSETATVKLATEYITPVINPKKNTTNTVTIEITDIYNDYKGGLFVELQDYALNSNMYYINTDYSQTTSVCPSDFKIMYNGNEVTNLTIDKNTAVKLSVDNLGGANISNFIWESSDPETVLVKNGELFGVSAGSARITVRGGNGRSQSVNVTVADSNTALKAPTVSFGTMLNYNDLPVKASGFVSVNPAQVFTLSIEADPWYYPIENYNFIWSSSDPELATVTQDGTVTVLYEGDKVKNVTITATAEGNSSISAMVVLTIRDPFTITNGTLTKYSGWGGVLNEDGVRVLEIPSDRSIMTIGDEAFKDCKNVEIVIIPKAVTSIGERAFIDCVNLKEIYFISQEAQKVADSSLTIIHVDAFSGCKNLTKVDLSNCKVITLDRNVFAGCTALKEVVKMTAIGTMYTSAFSGCTSLEKADLSQLHVAFNNLFMGCTSLKEVTIGATTALGANMFRGCTSLESVEINCSAIPAYAFYGCSALKEVTLNCDTGSAVTIGNYAFANCSRLANFNLNGRTVSSVGDYAFSNCVRINNLFAEPEFKPALGVNVFQYVSGMTSAVVKDGTLLIADSSITSSTLPEGVTAIGSYAFSDCVLTGVNTIDLTGVTSIGAGAFYRLYGLTEIVLPEGLTEIPASAFRGTAITSIVIPASVQSIGASAFANCSSLTSVTFADGSQLKTIGANAFEGTAITEISIPDGVTTIGDEAFNNIATLVTAEISSVTSMGEGVFAYCPALTTVKFGANATTTGTYTFYAQSDDNGYGDSSLTTVELSDKIKEIGAGTFAFCSSLKSIDLKNATVIGDEAFFACANLETVTGIEKVTAFGSNAMSNCISMTEYSLDAVESINYRAFFNNSSLNTLTFGAKLDGIGDEAFAESAITTVTIPASCTYVGVSAFSGALSLYEFVVEDGSASYFADGGVLYRYINKANGTYELCAYPAGRTAEIVDGVPTYTVLEGTVTTQSFAFYAIPESRVSKVILPYTLKLVGNGAFFNSGITTYQFESITAPTLLEDVSIRVIDTNSYSHNSFFYNNFVNYLAYYASTYPGAAVTVASPLTILYPANGNGYDNYIYSSYFGTKVLLDEMPEDSTRELLSILESASFFDAATVAGWKNDGSISKAEVEAFAAEVTRAHVLYNGLSTEAQLNYVGQENIDKLFAVEAALMSVKQEFNITVRVSSVALSANSAHKTQYKVGDKFSLSGLKLLVTFDDYSQLEINAADGFRIMERFDRALRATDEAVTLEGFGDYAGRTISIKISVSENGGASDGNNGGSLGTLATVLVVVGVVALVAVAAVVTVLVLIKKKIIVVKDKKSKEDEAEKEEEALADKTVDELKNEEAATEAENAEAETDNTQVTEEPAESGENGEEGNTDD